MTNPISEQAAPRTDDTRCTEFTTQHGLANPDPEAFYFGFVCPRCDRTNPLKGDPETFHENSVRCMQCTAVVVLDGTALTQFAEGVEAYE